VPETGPRRLNWTHDEVVLVCDLLVKKGWQPLTVTEPDVIELSNFLRALPLYPRELRLPQFRNPNGVVRKAADLATHHPDYAGRPTNGGKIDKDVLANFLADPDRWHRVAAMIRKAAPTETISGALVEIDEEVELEAPEGRLLVRQHLNRERSRKLREAKIKAAVSAQQRHLECQICAFDFEKRYGTRGEGFIECHHVVPLHEAGPGMTKLSDLILICANCHRMIHRRSPWLTPDQLRALIEN